MNRNDNCIKITFGDPGSAPELELNTPLYSTAGTRMWAALASLSVSPISAFLVRNDNRLITRVKLTDRRGAPLSQHRAVKVMGVLKERLFSGAGDRSTVMRRAELEQPPWSNRAPAEPGERWIA